MLDYTLWRSTLRELDQLLPAFTDTNANNAVSTALQSLKLTSGFAMDGIWAQQKPYFDGQQRVRALLDELQPEGLPAKQSGDLSRQNTRNN